ncbi:Glutathione S-transferase GST-6.0 [Usitatibacter rugosus]|uniref:Glutathione S-transferase GST-6.0 n=1 Tax=Usitatibacter rugosus TaxID=2732067 RepID=A0A6M4GY98_9PROT|nr:glutathione transferase GstA [Usitatibacter rugosus]QJR11888.1 Glutathione S-transferase GST-6.0 [Usitatibacter rugosus]
MKLYFSPGACSLSPHIALREAGLDFTLQKVDTKTKQLDGGGDYLALNGKGYVPMLEMKDGDRLTEGPAIVQYIADLAPASKLAPAAGTKERVRLQEWLNFITSEIHKGFTPLFQADTPEDYKPIARAKLSKRFDWLAKQLEGKTYLTGDTFTVADGYLFVVLNWTKFVGIDLTPWPALTAFQARVGARPKVQEALRAEGLLQKA